MKKVNYLIALMFAVVLMSTSCEKPANDNLTPSTTITASDLVGNWIFQSLEFQSTPNTADGYTTKALSYNYVTVDFKNVTANGKLTLHSDYNKNGHVEANSDFTVTDGKIIVNGSLTFEIQPATDILSGKLVIKFVSQNISNNPVGAIYTLKRQ